MARKERRLPALPPLTKCSTSAGAPIAKSPWAERVLSVLSVRTTPICAICTAPLEASLFPFLTAEFVIQRFFRCFYFCSENCENVGVDFQDRIVSGTMVVHVVHADVW